MSLVYRSWARAVIRFSLLLLLLAGVGLIQGCGSGGSTSPSVPGPGGENPPTGNSQSGALASMLTYEATLYALNQNKLSVFDITSEKPNLINTLTISGAASLHRYSNYLYVGTSLGITIYDISSPHNPMASGFLADARGCDAIIVQDDVGYVSVRQGGDCGNLGRSSIRLMDFTNPEKPDTLGSFPVTEPYGIAKSPNFLAVCEGLLGLSLFNVADVNSVSLATTVADVQCFDAIYDNQVLITTTFEGIKQFSINGESVQLLSFIPIKDPVWQ